MPRVETKHVSYCRQWCVFPSVVVLGVVVLGLVVTGIVQEIDGVREVLFKLGLAKQMLKSAISLSASANVPAISGIFTAQRIRDKAEELGFVKLNEISYENFVINDKVIFTETAVQNQAAALMAYRIPNIQETPDLPTQQISRFNIAASHDDKNIPEAK